MFSLTTIRDILHFPLSADLAYFMEIKAFLVCICVHFYVYIITVSTMTPHSRASWVAILICRSLCSCDSVTVLLVVFFLCVLTSEGGSVCLGVAILCTVMCFLGFITSCPNLLSCFCFFLSLPSLLPPLSYCSPPTGCAFVTFATRAMAQNAIKTMHHSQTMEVLYPLAPVSHFPLFPSHTCCCPVVSKRWKLKKRQPCPNGWCPFITEHDSFPKSLLAIIR